MKFANRTAVRQAGQHSLLGVAVPDGFRQTSGPVGYLLDGSDGVDEGKP